MKHRVSPKDKQYVESVYDKMAKRLVPKHYKAQIEAIKWLGRVERGLNRSA